MITRRQFIKTTGAALAGGLGTVATGGCALAAPRGANESLQLAVVGVNGIGHAHVRSFSAVPGVRVVAICDVDDAAANRVASQRMPDGARVETFRDLRELFQRRDIDAVAIAMPNHWHALASIWACQAGKHVFVETPVSHSVWEGRQMVAAARKYDRVVRAALDHHSDLQRAAAYDFVRSGVIGKIEYARVIDYERRTSIGKVDGPQAIPAHIDYDLWTGPAPMRPLMREFLHFDWHWQWDTGGGPLTCNGARLLDEVRWAIGNSRTPRQVVAFGGRYGYVDDGETPNTLVAVFDCDGVPVIYEARGLSESRKSENMDAFRGETVAGTPVIAPHDLPYPNTGCVLFCEGGYCLGNVIYDNEGQVVRRFERESGPSLHEEFASAVRARGTGQRQADIAEGHVSATMCHIGNISYRCGETVSFERARATLSADEQATRALERMVAHLRDNGVDSEREALVVGPPLEFDHGEEQFVGPFSARANLLLKDAYRAPFVVADEV